MLAWHSDDGCDKTYPLFLAYFGLGESLLSSMFYVIWYGRVPFTEIKSEEQWMIELMWCRDVREEGSYPHFKEWVCYRSNAERTHLELKRACRRRPRAPIINQSQVPVIPAPIQDPELVRQNEELIRMVRELEQRLRGIHQDIHRGGSQVIVAQPQVEERVRLQNVILRRAGVDAFNYMRNVCSICAGNIEVRKEDLGKRRSDGSERVWTLVPPGRARAVVCERKQDMSELWRERGRE